MSLFRTIRATSALRTRRMFPQQFQFRSMSLIALEGEEEVENFRALNSKSILMFTASWYVGQKVVGLAVSSAVM